MKTTILFFLSLVFLARAFYVGIRQKYPVGAKVQLKRSAHTEDSTIAEVGEHGTVKEWTTNRSGEKHYIIVQLDSGATVKIMSKPAKDGSGDQIGTFFGEEGAPADNNFDEQPTDVCCKHCKAGKPCGNSCISRNKECRRGHGCACGSGESCCKDRFSFEIQYLKSGCYDTLQLETIYLFV